MTEFDAFSEDYREKLSNSLGALGNVDLALKSKLLQLDRVFGHRATNKARRILDFGAGTGLLSQGLYRYAEEVIALDVSLASLRHLVTSQPCRVAFDGTLVPLANASVDMAVASCVFHHIEPPDRPGVAAEIRRVLKPGGMLVIIEHNPWNPVTRWVVNRCEFDKDARLLTMGEARSLMNAAGLRAWKSGFYYTVPPASRALAKLDSLFRAAPLGAQYFCAATSPA